MTEPDPVPQNAFRRLRWPLRLTLWGMAAERVTRAFWPLWSILFLLTAALMFGLHEALPLEAVWAGAVLGILGAVGALIRGGMRLRWPQPAEALDRLDRTLPGRPITALADTQAIGSGDPADR